MQDQLFIPIILGTGRLGRSSERVAGWLLDQIERSGWFETDLIDPKEFDLPSDLSAKDTPSLKKWQALASRADGYIIVSPEYNHGYPAGLKNMLDYLYQQFNQKPVGLAGVSAGQSGGIRVVEQLRLVAIELQMVPIRSALYFGSVKALFDSQGELTNQNQADYKTRLDKFLSELIWYAQVLKQGRASRPRAW